MRGVLRAWFSWDRVEPGWRKGEARREPGFMLPSYPDIAFILKASLGYSKYIYAQQEREARG